MGLKKLKGWHALSPIRFRYLLFNQKRHPSCRACRVAVIIGESLNKDGRNHWTWDAVEGMQQLYSGSAQKYSRPCFRVTTSLELSL